MARSKPAVTLTHDLENITSLTNFGVEYEACAILSKFVKPFRRLHTSDLQLDPSTLEGLTSPSLSPTSACTSSTPKFGEIPSTRSKFGERAFSYAGPAAWNRLPVTIRQAQTQERFQKLFKNILFTEFYNCC